MNTRLTRTARTIFAGSALAATALALAPTNAQAETPAGPSGPQTAGTIQADNDPCVEEWDYAGSHYSVRQCGVADVDQFRAGLENNGSSYCGPASLFNILKYWADTEVTKIGWGSTDVQFLDPEDPADYNVITNSIWRIGVDSSYDSGTNVTNLRKAFMVATKPVRDDGGVAETGWIDTHNNAGDDFARDLAHKLLQGPVQLAYGRYGDGPTAGSFQRTGGHIVTVIAAKGAYAGNTIDIEISDPGRAPDHGVGNYLKHQSGTERLTAQLKKRTVREYVPARADDPDTADDETRAAFYRNVDRWQLTGSRYQSTSTVLVEGFNWFRVDE